MVMYHTDNDDVANFGDVWHQFPASGWRVVTWVELIAPYGKNPDITGSPSSFINDKNQYGWRACEEGSGRQTVYNVSLKPNGALWPRDPSWVGRVGSSLSRIENPSGTVLMVDSPQQWSTIDPTQVRWGSPTFTTQMRVKRTETYGPNCSAFTRFYNNDVGVMPFTTSYSGQSVFAMADGSARTMKLGRTLRFESPDGDNMWALRASLVTWLVPGPTTADWYNNVVIPNLHPEIR